MAITEYGTHKGCGGGVVVVVAESKDGKVLRCLNCDAVEPVAKGEGSAAFTKARGS